MTDSKTQRKLMLLFHRVSSLKDKTLAAGTIAVSKGADSAWVLRSPGGFEEVIIGVRAFEEYARGRSFKPATLQHLNAIIPKLFPANGQLANRSAIPMQCRFFVLAKCWDYAAQRAGIYSIPCTRPISR
ncbi:hypothetical protein [Teredinibacter turnerae]|uniref:hypothetical protein n=1 Tax=Teredinibacter turnerae TaxID=2426 RepID=UPI0030CF5EBA